MTLSELKTGLNKALQSVYSLPDYQYYGLDVVEGYQRPCFFTQLKPITMEMGSFNTYYNQATFYIDYHQPKVDEVDIMSKVDTIRSIFQSHVKISDRAIKVIGFDYDFIGTDRNILEISIDLEWSDQIKHANNQPEMTELTMKNETEE